MRIHKIEAAKRQLDTAISLFFSDGDPCSIIALASSAEEVLGHYADGTWVKQNADDIFNRMYKKFINRGLGYNNMKEFSHQIANTTKNALKHANSAGEQYVSINEEEVVIRLMRALVNYQIGSGIEFSEQMCRFEKWLRNNRPKYLLSE